MHSTRIRYAKRGARHAGGSLISTLVMPPTTAGTEPPSTGDDPDFRIPAPLPEPPRPFVAVGQHGPSSVDAEDFSRKLGNWGNASRYIGEQWEALAPGLLWRRLPWRVPLGGGHAMTVRAIVAVDADPGAGPVLQRAGISAPDLLLIGEVPSGRIALRAADCKVSLDTADREQTAPARLQAMFTRTAVEHPSVGAALLRQLEVLPDDGRRLAVPAIAAALAGDWRDLLLTEGLFVAPESGFNRWFVERLDERRRTGVPLGRLPSSGPRRSQQDLRGPVDAAQLARLQLPTHLEAIDVADFLASLPGWDEAGLVAQLDGAELAAVDLSVAERCWRVGAGLRGAVLALRRPLFHRPLPFDGPRDGALLDTRAVLDQLRRRRQPRDSAELVAAVAQFVAGRRPLWDREAAALRAPLSFPAWSARLGEAIRALIAERSETPGTSGAAAVPGAAGWAEVTLAEAGTGERRSGKAVERVSPSARVTYRDLTRRHTQRVTSIARSLEGDGLDEAAILAALEARAEELRAAAIEDAGVLAAAMAQAR